MTVEIFRTDTAAKKKKKKKKTASQYLYALQVYSLPTFDI